MSFGVFLAVIGAAFLHALWNALIKLGTSKLTGMLILTLVQGGIGLIIATRREQPAGQIWLWLLASGCFHTAYKLFLAYAYDRGDLSRVYPIARGAAPMIVLAVAAFALNDRIGAWEYTGILVLGVGILLMARGVLPAA
jgi:drug/metabolite transporter (DMT)-like permease